ncbi:MHYT domain-containing protein [Dongia sp.]|uniref:MHYT domain-containing protein n=1 Tax=Dongia sp. TaxID=1977262 RepID=UPI00375268E9
MLFSYDPMMVVASVLVAIMASFTGLRLAGDLSALPVPARRLRIAEAACALGGGIWSMHFVGMLALRLPVSISYDALNTLSSVLVSILITGLGLSFVHMGQSDSKAGKLWRTAVSGTLIGLGIVTMHYIGMRAIAGNCLVEYGPTGILLSSGIAILSSIAVVQIAYRRRTLLQLSLAAVLLGITISSMHYTAMAFTRIVPVSELIALAQPMIQDSYLALIVALAAFVVCGLFLLTALPLPATGWIAAPAGAPIAAAFAAPEPQALPQVASPRAASETTERLRLPYEQGGLTFFVDATRVTAIQAEGHYTRLYEGQESHFCPWSISRVEEAVAGRNFLRTHRSFLVNLEHARAFQRKHDKVFLMVPGPEDNLVPVSRGHVPEVRKALGI